VRRRENPEKRRADYKRKRKALKTEGSKLRLSERKRKSIQREKRYQLCKDFVYMDKITRGGCLKCGESRPSCLDYHHRDPSMKTANVSEMLKNGSLEKLSKEISKCDILCSNCHRVEEHGDGFRPEDKGVIRCHKPNATL